MTPLLLFPFNGNTLEALDAAVGHEILGFIDDGRKSLAPGLFPDGFRVPPLLTRHALVDFPEAKLLAAPGNDRNFRERGPLIEGLRVPRERFATVIHPRASVSPMARLGANTLILAGAVITSNAVIGDSVAILPNAVIHHDSVVGELTLIGAGAVIAGSVRIGRNCYIGSGATLIGGIEIGDGSIVGMGANVLKSCPPGSKLVGNPARARG